MAVKQELDPKAAMILDEAEKMALSQGFRRFNLDVLARKLRISKKTVYVYFPSKEELFFAALNRRASRLIRHLKEVNASRASARNKLYVASELVARDLSELDNALMRDLEELFPDFYVVSRGYFPPAHPLHLRHPGRGRPQRGVPRGFEPGAGDPPLSKHRRLPGRPGVPGAQPAEYGEGLLGHHGSVNARDT